MSIPTSDLAEPGGIYNVGFAVYDDNIPTHGHQISFVTALGLGVKKRIKPDIYAVKLPVIPHWMGLVFRRLE